MMPLNCDAFSLPGLTHSLIPSSVIRFSLDCLESSRTAGISIPLLSVSLASLMALFRCSDVASNVGVGDLTSLIRETGTILLDPRFSAESSLDEATCAQMAKAINKTAVNAATGAPRVTSFQALIAVQQQLAEEVSVTVIEDINDLNSRLSRVISRLFVRVIKSEESSEDPYAPIHMDMESLVCIMEDTLESCKATFGPPMDACKEMVLNLTESILKSYGHVGQLHKVMEDASISVTSSLLAGLLNSLSPGGQTSTSDTVKRPSVAELVTALGNSREGVNRDTALAELRKHREEFGTVELNAYLEEVSPAFRKFIEDQLNSGITSPSNSESSNSMSERLRKLRTRLQATERAVNLVDDEPGIQRASQEQPKPMGISNSLALPHPAPSRSSRLALPSPRSRKSHLSPSRRVSTQSGLTRPSPSKLPKPGPPSTTTSAESRYPDGTIEQQPMLSSNSTPTNSERTAAAASLRARLEAVKQGKK